MTMRVNQRMAVLPGRALGDRRLSDRHIRILGVLCLVEDAEGHQGRDGWFEITHRSLAALVDKSRPRVVATVNELVVYGYLACEAQRGSDGSKLRNRYKVLYDAPAEAEYDRWAALTDDDAVTAAPLLEWSREQDSAPVGGESVSPRTTVFPGNHDVTKMDMGGKSRGNPDVTNLDMDFRFRNMGPETSRKHDVTKTDISRVESSHLPPCSGIDSSRVEASAQTGGARDARSEGGASPRPTASPTAPTAEDVEAVVDAFLRLRTTHFPQHSGGSGLGKLRDQAAAALALLPRDRVIEVLEERISENAREGTDGPFAIKRYHKNFEVAAQLDREADERRERVAAAPRPERTRRSRPEGWQAVFEAIGSVAGEAPTPDSLAFLGVEAGIAQLAAPSKLLQDQYASAEILSAAAKASGAERAEIHVSPVACKAFARAGAIDHSRRA